MKRRDKYRIISMLEERGYDKPLYATTTHADYSKLLQLVGEGLVERHPNDYLFRLTIEGFEWLDEESPRTLARRHQLPEGECAYCDAERKASNNHFPSHDASPRCESGKHSHCTCDACW